MSVSQTPPTTISPLLLSPFHQLTPPPSVSPSSSSSSLPSPGKTSLPPIKIPSPPTPSYSWSRANLALLASHNVPGPITGQAEPEDWTREASKENKADSSKDNEEDETDDELVIEEPDPSASKEEGAEKLSAVSPPELTGELITDLPRTDWLAENDTGEGPVSGPLINYPSNGKQ